MHGHRRPSRGWIFWLPIVLLALPAAVSGDADDAFGDRVTGTAVTSAVPHVRESLDDLRRLAPARRAQDGERRAIPFRRTPRTAQTPASESTPPVALPSESGLFPTSAALAPGAFDPLPIRRSSTVEIDFPGLQNFPLPDGRDVIPPDTMGAAGPNHLVSILNSEFGVFGKDGTLRSSVTLQSFWASLGTDPGEPADFPFDPKILFDQYSGRFVAITLDCTVAPHSWVLVAVSTTSNPLDPWDKFAIDADLDNNVQQYNNTADYPGLGVDASNIYITANMFSASDVGQYSKVWVIPKAQDLSGAGPVTWYEIRDPEPFRFSMQPAHSFGTSAAEYFLFEGNGSTLRLARIDNVNGTPVWHSSVPISITPNTYTPASGLTGAPQPGTDCTVDTADTRMLNAVYRNGSVWGTHHVPGAGGKTEVAWYRIDPSTNTAAAQGRIADAQLWYYYPSIAVNQDNVAALGFSGSSTEEHASAYYTVVWPSTGMADPVTLLHPGVAPYTKTLSGPSIRWGDFSATSVDPVDDNTFWTLQEYAAAPHQSTSMWGTWWGKIVPGQPTPPPPPSGGGGCAIAGRSSADGGGDASFGSFLYLLLPGALYGYRRILRLRNGA
jgi:hypothetical protein